IPLKQVAEIVKQTGASFIYREDNGRYIPIKFSVRGRDLQSTIAEAEEKIAEQIKLPAGYHYEWAGEFQELEAAVARLEIVVPVSLLIIFFPPLQYLPERPRRVDAHRNGATGTDRRTGVITRDWDQLQYCGGSRIHFTLRRI